MPEIASEGIFMASARESGQAHPQYQANDAGAAPSATRYFLTHG